MLIVTIRSRLPSRSAHHTFERSMAEKGGKTLFEKAVREAALRVKARGRNDLIVRNESHHSRYEA
jgi:hypothetical protein